MGFGQGVIKFDGFARSFVGQKFGLLRSNWNVAGSNVVNISQTGVREGIVGVGGNRLLKQCNAFLQAIWRASIPKLAAFEIETISFRIRRGGAGKALLLGATQMNAQAARNVARNIALQLRYIGGLRA